MEPPNSWRLLIEGGTLFRTRTRPAYSPAELEEVYSSPWAMDEAWLDHVARRDATLSVMNNNSRPVMYAADLSCGDSYFADHFQVGVRWYLGDYAEGYQFQGPIEETIDRVPHVDLFLLCETLEHLDDPELVLRKIRAKTHTLVLSTPKMTCFDENPQHYWAWDDEAVLEMLLAAGFSPAEYKETRPDIGYVFQVWRCI